MLPETSGTLGGFLDPGNICTEIWRIRKLDNDPGLAASRDWIRNWEPFADVVCRDCSIRKLSPHFDPEKKSEDGSQWLICGGLDQISFVQSLNEGLTPERSSRHQLFDGQSSWRIDLNKRRNLTNSSTPQNFWPVTPALKLLRVKHPLSSPVLPTLKNFDLNGLEIEGRKPVREIPAFWAIWSKEIGHNYYFLTDVRIFRVDKVLWASDDIDSAMPDVNICCPSKSRLC